jgi:hypothetical protein
VLDFTYGVTAPVQVTGTADDTNPNRETIGVSVFDQYGNALEGYKVTWEIVGQGTTETSGFTPTYHPYAHLALPEHSIGNLLIAGTGDLNPFVDSNKVWGIPNAPAYTRDAGDEDYAWGWTLNHQINFTKDLASAAHVDLVLDETAGTLADMAPGITHFSDIVNIHVYTPAGVLVDGGEFEVTKSWSLDEPVVASKALAISTTSAGPWVTALSTNNSPIYYRILLLDQFGNPWVGPDADLMLAVSGPAAVAPIDLSAAQPDPDGYVTGSFVPAIGGTWTLTPWNDTGNATGVGADDDLISPGELTGNPAVLTFTGQANPQP